ncbi:hypothetical protein ACIRL3_25825 [Streptomyces sp. NPDC102384]|uniref:zinc finger domain-containing protein n=1 Tax=Streptomyces sp. NPDC102384 TaxID=3366166 RepID=UPI003804CB01
MERREVAAVLTYVGRLDPRIIRTDAGEARDQLAMWHELLGDVPMATHQGWDVRDVVRKRVVASPYPILPADVAREWNAHYRDRLGRHTDPTPMANPDDPQAWRAELVATRDAVVTGRIAPSPHRGVTSGEARPGLKNMLDAVGTYVPDAVRAELAPFRPARAAREAAIAAGGPDIFSVPCERCRSAKGEPCRERSGGGVRNRNTKPRIEPHPVRVERALAAQAQALPA